MKLNRLLVVAAVLASASPLAAYAQTRTDGPAPSASAASGVTGRALRTPTEIREGATEPGDLRPENPVIPQIAIPIGRKQIDANAATPLSAADRGKAAGPGGIDDGAARCNAQRNESARAICRDKLSHLRPSVPSSQAP